MLKKQKRLSIQSPYFIWFLGAFFFFIDYIVRVSPSILTPVLMNYFNVNAFAIGGFSAFFYYTYITMQIPVGILVDRYGPKWLLLTSALVCGLSCFIFAKMTSIEIGFLSRVLMGFGASFAFVGTLKLISIWFLPKHFAFLAGMTQAFGMLGAMVGQGPMAVIYQFFGWRFTMLGFVILFLILSLLMLLMNAGKDNAYEDPLSEGITLMQSLKLLLKNSQNWLNCLFIGLLYGPSASFGEQWGASFLSLKQNISIDIAGAQTGMMFIGLAIGCPILGWISDKIQRRILVMRICVLLCFLLLSVIIYDSIFPKAFNIYRVNYTFLLFLYGFFNSGIVCSYALASEINPSKVTGIALGITNMAAVAIGAIMIPIIGFILDHFSGVMNDGKLLFSVYSYQIAFIALPVSFIFAFIISFFQKETYCKRAVANPNI